MFPLSEVEPKETMTKKKGRAKVHSMHGKHTVGDVRAARQNTIQRIVEELASKCCGIKKSMSLRDLAEYVDATSSFQEKCDHCVLRKNLARVRSCLKTYQAKLADHGYVGGMIADPERPGEKTWIIAKSASEYRMVIERQYEKARSYSNGMWDTFNMLLLALKQRSKTNDPSAKKAYETIGVKPRKMYSTMNSA